MMDSKGPAVGLASTCTCALERVSLLWGLGIKTMHLLVSGMLLSNGLDRDELDEMAVQPG